MDTLAAASSFSGGMGISVALAAVVVTLALWTVLRPRGFPPGPRGLPVVGSIFSMTDYPEVIFERWAKQYGDVFGFKAGERWIVVVNGQEAVKDASKRIDFADRPDFYSTYMFSEGFKDIAFSPFSETWKLHRKLAHTALRHFATGKPLHNLISSTYPKLQKELASNGDKPIDPRLLLTLLMYNILSQMCFGKSYPFNDPKVKTWMKLNDDVNVELGLGLAADFFRWAAHIPTGGVKRIRSLFNQFIEIPAKEVREFKEKQYDPENIDNFLGLLLKAQEDARKEGENVDKLTDTHVQQTISDIFFAGTQTTIDTLYWSLALMCEYPDVQAKVQSEIDRVVGQDCVLTIDDRGTLPYSEATLYEVMRYSTIAPIALPHATTRECEFRGFIIPEGAVVLPNIYSMHFDPKEWTEPESFKPEHFLDESGTVRQHPQSFMPFGTGRRSCLGEAVAKADLFLIFTWFMQNYTFNKVPGKENETLLDMIPPSAGGRILRPYQIIIKERA